MDIKQMILYEDRDILVCHKAAGIPVQSAGVGTKDLESILLNYLRERQQAERENKAGKGRPVRSDSQGVPYLGIVHRLDQPVEGILVFAGNKKAAAGLSRQISDGRMKKEYFAVCCVDKGSESVDKSQDLSAACGGKAASVLSGSFESKSGEEPERRSDKKKTEKTEKIEKTEKTEIHLTDWLKKDARTNTSFVVSQDTPGAKKSELEYCVLQRKTAGGREYDLVRIRLLTGRHHQIRVQMANAGLPLYGDRKYNTGWKEHLLPEYDGEGRSGLKLCAAKLIFEHPVSGKEMRFEIRPLFLKNFEK